MYICKLECERSFVASDLSQPQPLPDTAAIAPQLPRQPRPIVIIGAGGIVQAAHLPAYAKAGFPVFGIADQIPERAESLAREHGIQHAFRSVDDAVRFAPPHVVFDVAIPASQLVRMLPCLPDGSSVLMQKPMGETIDEAGAFAPSAATRAWSLRSTFLCTIPPITSRSGRSQMPERLAEFTTSKFRSEPSLPGTCGPFWQPLHALRFSTTASTIST